MGKVRRRRFLNRGLLWLHARVIPVAVNLCHFWKGVNAELDLEGTWIRASRGSWDHRELTAAINLGNLVIPYKPPAQRRMGVKRRPVDQGPRFNAGVIVAPARFSCGMTLDICDTGTAKFDRQRIWMLVCRCTAPGI